MFKGIFTAILTPFKYGEVDYPAFEKMVDWQIESGINGLVVGGSTGEGQNLTKEELLKLVEIAVKQSKGRIKIIANTGLNSTVNSIELTKATEALKVDAVMLVAPYYVKPTQEGMYQHFKAVHDAVKLPIIIYNIPGRTGVDISNETLVRLASLERIVALKDSTGNVLRCGQLRQQVSSKFQILSGDDALTLAYYSQGAVGVISVVSNIVPSLMVKMHELWIENKISEAIKIQDILHNLNEVLYCESNPVPLKYAASQFELCMPDVRLPLVPLAERSKKLMREALQDLKAKLYGRSK
jgi:4-hydroxy-tetrahydrodipicolinate synthase